MESTDRASAEILYQRWAQLIPPRKGKSKIAEWEEQYHIPASLYAEFSTFLNTTKSWYDEIFNYFDEDCQYTNASAEGTNKMIQGINYQGSGYGFERLRAKALYWSNVDSRITYSLDKSRMAIYKPRKKPTSFKKKGKTIEPEHYEDVTSITRAQKRSESTFVCVLLYRG